MRNFRANAGLTLVEVLIALSLFSLLLLVVTNSLIAASHYYRTLQTKSELQQEVTITLQFCAEEILGATGFESNLSDEAQLVFTNRRGEEVTYRQENGTLFRVVGAVQEPLAGAVSKWELFYHGDDPAAPDKFLLITLHLELVADVSPPSQNKLCPTYARSITVQPRRIQGVFDGTWVK